MKSVWWVLCLLALVISLQSTAVGKENEEKTLRLSLKEDGSISALIPHASLDDLWMISRQPPGTFSPMTMSHYFVMTRDGNTLEFVMPRLLNQHGAEINLDGVNSPLLRHESREDVRLASFKVEDTDEFGLYIDDVSSLFFELDRQVRGAEYDPARSKFLSVAVYGDISVVDGLIVTAGEERSSTGLRAARRVWTVEKLPRSLMPARGYISGMAYVTADARTGEAGLRSMADSIRRYDPSRVDRTAQTRDSLRTVGIYLDPSVPSFLVPAFELAIDMWNSALDKAELKIDLALLPAPEEVDWPVFAAAHNAIWYSDRQKHTGMMRGSPVGGGGGTAYHMVDIRTGEILRAGAYINYNVTVPFNRITLSYNAACGAIDPRTQEFPLPSSLHIDLLTPLVAHEVGHMLGLSDGNYGEGWSTSNNLRDSNWLREHPVGGVMNYTSCNYVAQPADGIAPELLTRRVSDAEILQLKIGYYQGDDAPERIRQWLATQKSPKNLFLPSVSGPGPQSHNYSVETSDVIASSRLGYRNLARSIDRLEDYAMGSIFREELIRLTYASILDAWMYQVSHVVSLVSGEVVSRDTSGVYRTSAVEKEIQVEAVKFVLDSIFENPAGLVSTELTNLVPLHDQRNQLFERQLRLFRMLTSELVFLRLHRECSLREGDCYSPDEHLDAIDNILFSQGQMVLSSDLGKALGVYWVDHLQALSKPFCEGRVADEHLLSSLQLSLRAIQALGSVEREIEELMQRGGIADIEKGNAAYLGQLFDRVRVDCTLRG